MSKILRYLLIAICGLLPGFSTQALAQKKLAQTGFEFLSVGTNAHATAMGEAYTTIHGNATTLFYNPAGLASVPGFIDISLNQMKWIADINYLSGSMALNFQQGRYGVFGLSFLAVDYGEFMWTQVADNEQGFEDIQGWPEPGAYMIGLGYARALSDRFSVGGQLKYAVQDLGKSIIPVYSATDTTSAEKAYNLDVIAFDFGTRFDTGIKSLAFGMSVRNFAREIKYEKEGFQLPLTFQIGVSMNLMDFLPEFAANHALLVSIDAVHPRSFPEYMNLGAEYAFLQMLFLRGGFISNHDDYGLTAGFGIRKFGVAIDYSYTPFEIFDNVSRMSVRFSF
ncbi:PorV/PorQ family protein [candidate division KSB1 bacterium]|nr:PorV/PorQ family protein [candidate division KSB1 bacterium]